MAEVISVRFKDTGKDYYFDPNGVTAKRGQYLIVETSKGLEYALCSVGNHDVPDDSVVPPLRPVIRVANDEDKRIAAENAKREEEALRVCKEKVIKHGLDMKLISAEYSFDGSKLLFFFTSDGRVDFRDLVKELAGIFHTRIELRQIGVRDEARMLGGLGICGRPFCCATFLDDFQPVSIKMAKTQGLSLNPTKISGTCGRLMCCLKYEQDAYEELVKNVPKVDAFVNTSAGKGSVIDVDLLRGTVRVKIEDQSTPTIKTFDAKEIEVLGGKAKRAEYLAALAAEKAVADEEAEARRAAARARRTAEMRAELEKKTKEEQRSRTEQAKQPKNQPKTQSKGQQKNQPKTADSSKAQSRAQGEGSAKNAASTAGGRQRKPQRPASQQRPQGNEQRTNKQPSQNEARQPKPKAEQNDANRPNQQGQGKGQQNRSRRRKPSGSKPQGGSKTE